MACSNSEPSSNAQSSENNEGEETENQEYILVWSDEFDDDEFMQINISHLNTQYNPFSSLFYIILNLAAGGDFLPNPDETNDFPQSLIVDYVRVYQK